MKKRIIFLLTALLLILPAVSALTLTEPRFGVADKTTFNVTVTTTSAASCKWSGIQMPFDFMNAFDETGSLVHKKVGITLSEPTNFYVNCSIGAVFEAEKFVLNFDLTSPVISRVVAEPERVVDAPLETTVTLDASEEVFCRYGLTHLYDEMQPVFGEETTRASYKEQHVLSLTSLQDNKEYNYAFICKDLANRTSAIKNLSVVVNTTIAPLIEWVKPVTGSYFSSQLINLSVKTNKKSVCRYGNVSDEIITQGGDFGVERMNHTVQITAARGSQTYYVKCSFASLETLTSSTSFVVDLTAPLMKVVNDSTDTGNPSYSPYLDKLYYSFEAEDNESGIKGYNFSIWGAYSIVKDWTITDNSEGWVKSLELTDGVTYSLQAKAQNYAGLWSAVKESDGITVKTAAICEITCGGNCSPCPAGRACEKNEDCESKKCINKRCEAASCSDKIKNGNESDVDCGGKCAPCQMGKNCNSHSDCASDLSCVNGKCGLAEHCLNNKKDFDEADIDCGGLECAKCTNGKTCDYDADCLSERCYENKCVKKGDIDSDGISDAEDNCPANVNPRQEDMDKDGIGDLCDEDADEDGLLDSWEKTYFGAINANPDEDVDEDRLTNKQEQEKGTNPKEKDTDGDGYSDNDELKMGYDPLDEKSHPKNWWKWLLVIIVIIASIILLIVYLNKPKPTPLQPMQPAIPQKQYAPQRKQPAQPRPEFLKRKIERTSKREELLKHFEETAKNESKEDVFERLRRKRQIFKK